MASEDNGRMEQPGMRLDDVLMEAASSFDHWPTPAEIEVREPTLPVYRYLEQQWEISFLTFLMDVDAKQRLMDQQGMDAVTIALTAVLNQHELEEGEPLRWSRAQVGRRLTRRNLGEYTTAAFIALGLVERMQPTPRPTVAPPATGIPRKRGRPRNKPPVPPERPAESPPTGPSS